MTRDGIAEIVKECAHILLRRGIHISATGAYSRPVESQYGRLPRFATSLPTTSDNRLGSRSPCRVLSAGPAAPSPALTDALRCPQAFPHRPFPGTLLPARLTAKHCLRQVRVLERRCRRRSGLPTFLLVGCFSAYAALLLLEALSTAAEQSEVSKVLARLCGGIYLSVWQPP